jgi:hypothetical protein
MSWSGSSVSWSEARLRFTEKARLELEGDGLEPEDAPEAILSAPSISKAIVRLFGGYSSGEQHLYGHVLHRLDSGWRSLKSDQG